MIFANYKTDEEIDIEIIDNVVEREFYHYKTGEHTSECTQLQNWQKPAINVIGMSKDEAIKVLESEGFERITNPDPY